VKQGDFLIGKIEEEEEEEEKDEEEDEESNTHNSLRDSEIIF
jgi:hypothetical protein